MRNAKGLSTVTQGGEERANKIAAKQKQNRTLLKHGRHFKLKMRLTEQMLTSGCCCFCSIFIHDYFGFLECLGYMHRLRTWGNNNTQSSLLSQYEPDLPHATRLHKYKKYVIVLCKLHHMMAIEHPHLLERWWGTFLGKILQTLGQLHHRVALELFLPISSHSKLSRRWWMARQEEQWFSVSQWTANYDSSALLAISDSL